MGKGKHGKKTSDETASEAAAEAGLDAAAIEAAAVEAAAVEAAAIEAGAGVAEPDAGGAETDAKALELENRLLRLQADFDNFRKRVARERGETYARANEDLMVEIIPVLDHMDMALTSAAAHGAPQSILDGINLVAEQLKGVLFKFGLEKIDASGKTFDPNEHQAVAHLPSETVLDNMVTEQARMGYKLKGRILRPAQVIVSSGTGPDNKPADQPEVKG